MKKIFTPKLFLIIILFLSLLLRVFQLNYPKDYIFDEVYYAFTAKEYLKGSKEAWEWWTPQPAKFAFEWTHPPVGKEIMAVSIYILGSSNPWIYRLPGVISGIISILLVYLIATILFKNPWVGVFSAYIFSIDGLNFVLSRTGMVDIYLVMFILISLFFFLKNRIFLSSIFTGLALATKWEAIYLVGILIIFSTIKSKLKQVAYFILIPAVVYTLSYLPFFLLGHGFETFIKLQTHMFLFHMELRPYHDYSSAWWSWPLNLYPIWFVEQNYGEKISLIFATGNIFVFLAGVVALILTLKDLITSPVKDIQRKKALFLVLVCYFVFWITWAFFNRTTYLYYFAPSIPFLSIALGNQLFSVSKKRKYMLLGCALFVLTLGFIFIYPILTGISLSKDMLMLFFKTNLSKNPLLN